MNFNTKFFKYFFRLSIFILVFNLNSAEKQDQIKYEINKEAIDENIELILKSPTETRKISLDENRSIEQDFSPKFLESMNEIIVQPLSEKTGDTKELSQKAESGRFLFINKLNYPIFLQFNTKPAFQGMTTRLSNVILSANQTKNVHAGFGLERVFNGISIYRLPESVQKR